MTVSPYQNMRVGKVAPNQFQYARQDHGILSPGRAFAGTQYGCDQRAGQAIEDEQRQIAPAAVMVVVKRQWLLVVHCIFGVIHIQHQRRWRLRKAGDELLDQSLTGAVNIARAGCVFETGNGGAGCQRICRVKRRAPGPQAKHWIMTQRLTVIAICITGGNLKGALRQQTLHGALNVTWMTAIRYG